MGRCLPPSARAQLQACCARRSTAQRKMRRHVRRSGESSTIHGRLTAWWRGGRFPWPSQGDCAFPAVDMTKYLQGTTGLLRGLALPNWQIVRIDKAFQGSTALLEADDVVLRGQTQGRGRCGGHPQQGNPILVGDAL